MSDWSAWGSIGGSATSAPCAVCKHDGQIDVFVRNTANEISTKYYNPDEGWSAWGSLGAPPGGLSSPLPGQLADTPAAVCALDSCIDLFVKGADGALWTKYWRPDTGWSTWGSLGGVLSSAPLANVRYPPHLPGFFFLDIYVRNTAHRISSRTYTYNPEHERFFWLADPAEMHWNPWVNWDCIECNSGPAWSLGRIFALDTGGTIQCVGPPGYQAPVYYPPAIPPFDTIDVAANSPDTLDALPISIAYGSYKEGESAPPTTFLASFAKGTDDALWTAWVHAIIDVNDDDGTIRSIQGDLRSNGRGKWGSLGGVLTSPPAAVSLRYKTLDVFARGSDMAIWSRSYR